MQLVIIVNVNMSIFPLLSYPFPCFCSSSSCCRISPIFFEVLSKPQAA